MPEVAATCGAGNSLEWSLESNPDEKEVERSRQSRVAAHRVWMPQGWRLAHVRTRPGLGGRSKSLRVFTAPLDREPIRATLRHPVNERTMPARNAKRRAGRPEGALHIATYARLE